MLKHYVNAFLIRNLIREREQRLPNNANCADRRGIIDGIEQFSVRGGDRFPEYQYSSNYGKALMLRYDSQIPGKFLARDMNGTTRSN